MQFALRIRDFDLVKLLGQHGVQSGGGGASHGGADGGVAGRDEEL